MWRDIRELLGGGVQLRKLYERIPLNEQLEIVKLYQGGCTIREISKTKEVSYSGVRELLQRHSVEFRPNYPPPYFTDKEVLKIAYRVKHGETQRKIAWEFGVHETTISSTLRKRGYK